MNEDQDPYYGRPECSNSDLSILAKYWQSFQISYDIEKAYRFGTLVDCMLTEPNKVNYFQFTCAGWQYTREDFQLAETMKKVFCRDEYCQLLLKHSDTQKVTVNPKFAISHLGMDFTIPFRMKADFDALRVLKLIADFKTTNAETQKEFEKMVQVFHYDRQGAVYLDLAGGDQFLLVAVSKKPPHRLFKVPIRRGDPLYQSGLAKYQELAFRWYNLFGNLQIAA